MKKKNVQRKFKVTFPKDIFRFKFTNFLSFCKLSLSKLEEILIYSSITSDDVNSWNIASVN